MYLLMIIELFNVMIQFYFDNIDHEKPVSKFKMRLIKSLLTENINFE